MPAPLSSIGRERLSSVRLVATDIDGTMTRDGCIPPGVMQACLELASIGVEVLPVTGRSAGEALGLARYLPGVRRALAENGAVIVEPDRPLRFPFGRSDREHLLDVARRIVEGSPLVPAPCLSLRAADVAFEREGRSESALVSMRRQAEEAGVHLVWSSVHIHLSAQRPDKGAGVLAFAGEIGIGGDEIATIGDAPNDAGLWLSGRFGVTVGTADVLSHRDVIESMPSYVVGAGADGWLELASAIVRAVRERS